MAAATSFPTGADADMPVPGLTPGRILPDAAVQIERLVMGVLDNNVYFLSGIRGLVVVDPSCDAPAIAEALGGRVPDAILLTHYHWDHTGAAADLRERYGIPVVASVVDARNIEEGSVGFRGISAPACPVDIKVSDGDDVLFGTMRFRVIATPGHTMGSVCYYLEGTVEPGAESQGVPVLVSGDTLFRGTIGRTDFADSDPAAMRRSLAALAKLADATYVLPGHGDMTTIGDERSRVFARYCS